MPVLAQAKRVYQVKLEASMNMPANTPDTNEYPAVSWVPPGPIRIIGAALTARINGYPGNDLAIKASCYYYASVGLVPGRLSVHQIATAQASMTVTELPTAGEHILLGSLIDRVVIMFPDPLGMATDEWHPVYVSLTYKNEFAVTIGVAATADVYYVEL